MVYDNLVGWMEKSSIIVDEYTDYLSEGSQIDVIVPAVTAQMHSDFDAVAAKNTDITMNLHECDIHEAGAVARLAPEQYDNVIILKEGSGVAELRDSKTIASLLGFLHYFKGLGQPVTTQLVTEVADSDNVEMIQKVGVKDFLISYKFVSKIYAQVSEDPEVMKAYDELFKAEGSDYLITLAEDES